MSVKNAFETSKIVPDVIPTAPTALIGLNYPSGAVANLGNELAPTVVKDQPTVTYDADPSAYYTLVFTDPDNYDGPEPVYREWHHWLVGNIPGNKVSQGEVLSGYIGSGPPEGTVIDANNNNIGCTNGLAPLLKYHDHTEDRREVEAIPSFV
ncbi:OV-16 antigen [Papilio machaon]|uniref:OV-16 antigen n=1 Tax=Papilio machaon TaxID=76193 RepID=A0A0N1IBN2_PAPMA|nr:OV-16 antigen [Papilio machaon]